MSNFMAWLRWLVLVAVVLGSGGCSGYELVRHDAGGSAAVSQGGVVVVPAGPLADRLRAATVFVGDIGDGLSQGHVYAPDDVDKTADGVALALMSATGGVSLLAVQLFKKLRRVARESKRRGRVILEADAMAGTPPVERQVQSGEAMAEVARVLRGEGET